jgi:hypothetical protein
MYNLFGQTGAKSLAFGEETPEVFGCWAFVTAIRATPTV